MIDKIPEYLEPRNFVPICNKHDIIPSSHPDEWSMVIYFENEKCGFIKIMRLDQTTGWAHPIVIRVYNQDLSDFEDILVGSSETYFIHKFIYFKKINLLKHEFVNQKIPKIIIQTNETRQILSKEHEISILTLFDYNPEYEYQFYDYKKRREFIKNNFDSRIFNAYEKLYIKTAQADFFRYCIIYKLGGCYFDSKMICIKPIRDIIASYNDNIFCLDINENTMHNGIFFSIPNNKNLWNLILNIVCKIENNYMENDYFNFAGPSLFYQFTKNENKYLRLIKDQNYSNEKIQHEVIIRGKCKFIYRKYKNYYQKHRKVNYGELYKKKLIYYQNIQTIGNLTFKTLPFIMDNHLIQDKFKFIILNNNQIKIIRTDQNVGWAMNLTICVINNLDNSSKEICIGPSNHYQIIVNI